MYVPRPGSSKYHIGTVRKNCSPTKLKLIEDRRKTYLLKAVAHYNARAHGKGKVKSLKLLDAK